MSNSVPIPDPPDEGMEPFVRLSDWHCICGSVCVTDGTSGHWCLNKSCEQFRVVHPNKLARELSE